MRQLHMKFVQTLVSVAVRPTICPMIVHCKLAIHPKRCSRHQGPARHHACITDEVPRVRIVGGINDDVIASHQLQRIGWRQPICVSHHLEIERRDHWNPKTFEHSALAEQAQV